MVTFRVSIGTDWHSAHGEYEWAGDRPREEACAVAVSRAEDEVRERVGRTQTVSEKTWCAQIVQTWMHYVAPILEPWPNCISSDRIQTFRENFGIMAHPADTFWTVLMSDKMCAPFKE
jgi:hypothetical protein